MKTLLLISIFALSVAAQTSNKWHNLTLDRSTVADVIKELGQPKSDKSRHLYVVNNKWFTEDVRKPFRVLEYGGIEGFKEVKLGFVGSDILRIIDLEPEKLTAQAFVGAYEGLTFRFGNEAMSPADLKSNRDVTDRPARLGAVYAMVAADDNAFVFGEIGNVSGNFSSGLFGNADSRQSGRTVPGKVAAIFLVSRTLENKDGTNLLK